MTVEKVSTSSKVVGRIIFYLTEDIPLCFLEKTENIPDFPSLKYVNQADQCYSLR